jgi:tRNA (cmo5U34)-methyltransferase
MIVDFVFDESVANVFPDMIRRSVPGYETIVALIGLLAEQYAQDNSNIYDLGCSLGAATLSMRRCLKHEGCRIIAVDNAEAMVHRCKENVATESSPVATEVIQSDIQNVEIRNASVAVLNFSLQFIDPDHRLALLKNIYKGLNPGGILIISDKIVFDDETEQRIQEDLHHAFKKANGYSDLEISQKRSALENVLIPDTLPEHLQRLDSAGFACSHVWFQCFNFVSLIAFK